MPASELTARNDDPEKVHHEVVAPEIVCFGSAIGQALVVVVEHRCSIIEHIAIDLSK
jgi:hypothetical protein